MELIATDLDILIDFCDNDNEHWGYEMVDKLLNQIVAQGDGSSSEI
jgi:hypothetical protein